MIRVLHERCALYSQVRDRRGDMVWTVMASGVPCEMVPLSSREQAERGLAPTTEYLFVTRSQVLPTRASSWAVAWRGRTWQLKGNLEDHYVRGRLHHREGVVGQTPVLIEPVA
ncbi:hypothetical protein [Dermacoccus nishinomiyaensis]|uniref:hypothetical protein n=1 Tax=Dermacoccus nishinomiyaensis TaxID=1274 RepID=UPI00248EFAA1|nr:hypothetical protein [Dermacoccus nishinomiyaensis]